MGTTKITGFGFCMFVLGLASCLAFPLHYAFGGVAILCGLLGGRYGTSFD